MSASKRDSYYEAHADRDCADPDYRESSDEDSSESDIPQSMVRDRAQWTVDNADALAELFNCFRADGRALFTNAFFQLGTINEFSKFVYKYTSPGADT